MVSSDGRRPKFLLEKQSLLDPGLYRGRRRAASSVGDDRFGEEGRYQRHPNRLGESVCQALLSAFLGRGGRAFLRGNQRRNLASISHGFSHKRQGRNANAATRQLEYARALSAHLDDGIIKHLRHPWFSGQTQLRGICNQRSVYRTLVGRRAI